jgi:polygalacturonase
MHTLALRVRTALLSSLLFLACVGVPAENARRFDVRAFGASGERTADARPAIQGAIDACAEAGGGTVVIPPGEYTSGSIELRSHVRLVLESGATLYSAKGRAAFPKDALLYGEDLDNVTLEGRGTLDGRAAYEWRENDIDDRYIYPNLVLMQAAGKSLRRPFPTADSVGHLVQLVRCKDVQVRGLSFVRSPSWTMHLWGCERVVVEGVDIRTDLVEGVWADGIDPDGCRDLRVSNSTIETGDDALVFYSTNTYGPARPCEDITVTNCRLTSSSSAIKFCDGNQNCVRRVTIDNCVITNSNRGLAFMDFDGGYVSDVVIANLSIECTRRDWYWWGDGDPIHFNVKRRHEIDSRRDPGLDPPAGSIRNVLIRDVIARGTGTSSIEGHPDNPLENVTIDGLVLHVSCDPHAPYDKADHALSIRNVKNFALRDVEIVWDEPRNSRWRSAVHVESATDLVLDGFAGRQALAGSSAPTVDLVDVDGALLRGCRALAGCGEFLHLSGTGCGNVELVANDLRAAAIPFGTEESVPDGVIRSTSELLPRTGGSPNR